LSHACRSPDSAAIALHPQADADSWASLHAGAGTYAHDMTHWSCGGEHADLITPHGATRKRPCCPKVDWELSSCSAYWASNITVLSWTHRHRPGEDGIEDDRDHCRRWLWLGRRFGRSSSGSCEHVTEGCQPCSLVCNRVEPGQKGLPRLARWLMLAVLMQMQQADVKQPGTLGVVSIRRPCELVPLRA